MQASTTNKKSAKITNLSFFMALCIVMLHSRLPMIGNLPESLVTMNYFNNIGAGAVPVFIFITGYLFFRNYDKDLYTSKLKSRLRTLLVPYIIWNTILALVWNIGMLLFGKECVTDNISFDSTIGIITNIVASKYSILWFIAVIFAYALLAPVVYNMVKDKRIGIISIIVTAIVAVAFRHPYCSPLLWLPLYASGAWIGLHKKDLMYEYFPVSLTILGIILFPIFLYLDIFHSTRFYMNMVHWTAPLLFIGLYDLLDRVCHFRVYGVCKYSFMLYCMHYIPIHILQRYTLIHYASELSPWIAYIGMPVFVVVCVITVSYALDKLLPRTYALLAGNR